MSDGRRIYARVLRVPIVLWATAEIQSQIKDDLVKQVTNAVTADGMVPTGAHSLWVRFGRMVRFQHHEHGWEMREQACSQGDAEYAIISVEKMAEPVDA